MGCEWCPLLLRLILVTSVPAGWLLYDAVLANINVESMIVNVLAALGGAAVLFGGQYVKLLIARGKEGREDKKADLDVRKHQSAEDRKDRKDALDQMKEVVQMYKLDKESDRKLVHELRGELQASSNERAICEHIRKVQERRLARQERRLGQMEEALHRAGIVIPPLPPEPDDDE
jgi:hypothetical protein